MKITNIVYCKICKKPVPTENDPILTPCVCRDYREQFAKTGKIMHPITMEAFMRYRRSRK